MKLSQATREQKLKAAAELDGWTISAEWEYCQYGSIRVESPNFKNTRYPAFTKSGMMERLECLPNYLTSYDAIIQLIKKQDTIIQINLERNIKSEWPDCLLYGLHPSQILDFLLIATGKMTI